MIFTFFSRKVRYWIELLVDQQMLRIQVLLMEMMMPYCFPIAWIQSHIHTCLHCRFWIVPRYWWWWSLCHHVSKANLLISLGRLFVLLPCLCNPLSRLLDLLVVGVCCDSCQCWVCLSTFEVISLHYFLASSVLLKPRFSLSCCFFFLFHRYAICFHFLVKFWSSRRSDLPLS